MSIPLAFLLGILAYVFSVSLVYIERLKTSSFYFPAGILIGVVINCLWLYIAKNSGSKNQIYVNGLYWDSIIIGMYSFLPILLFGVRLTGWAAAGAALIVSGIALTKAGGV